MHFDSLRLSGFKSFVEPVEIKIKQGITGIVGPNGCGKSNLLEAMRWVMGESSYKNMRATSMDEVIFAGSAKRPARNIAEVTITLDNSDYQAPIAFNKNPVIEVTRKITRDSGSQYFINKKEVRARDVQLLFADASTGSRSPALVRQGQIGELINSKPQARRRILEEAAGITGLYTRRHEAEIKLNNTNNNLVRLEDIINQIEQQVENLKSQAKKAKKYREFSEDIRLLEAVQLYKNWQETNLELQELETKHNGIIKELTNITIYISNLNKDEIKASEIISPLRDNEDIRTAIVQRLKIDIELLDQEEQRNIDKKLEIKTNIERITSDISHAEDVKIDATNSLQKLREEKSNLINQSDNYNNEICNAKNIEIKKLEKQISSINIKCNKTRENISKIKTNKENITRIINERKNKVTRITTDLQKITNSMETLAIDEGLTTKAKDTEKKLQELEKEYDNNNNIKEENSNNLKELRQLEVSLHENYENNTRAVDRLTTEISTLEKFLQSNNKAKWTKISDILQVTPGYEIALGSALGDDLEASDNTNAPIYWSENNIDNNFESITLPEGIKPLLDYVSGAPALNQRLKQIGVINHNNGDKLQKQLRPGQRIVSIKGALWRWDGFISQANATSPAVVRLKERNRLTELKQNLTKYTKEREEARTKLNSNKEKISKTSYAIEKINKKLKYINNDIAKIRNISINISKQLSEASAQRKITENNIIRLKSALSEAKEELSIAEIELNNIANEQPLTRVLEKLQQELAELQSVHFNVKSEYDNLSQAIAIRKNRIKTIEQEINSWQLREEKHNTHIRELISRKNDLEQELQKITIKPAEISSKRNKLQNSLLKSENEQIKASDELALAEGNLAKIEAELKQFNNKETSNRERNARIEANIEATKQKLNTIANMTKEQLNLSPEQLPEVIGLTKDMKLPSLNEIEQKLTNFKKERENLGGVNLCAEEELDEANNKLIELGNEKEDLAAAIKKLRTNIADLNKEGRQRLINAFAQVNKNFRTIFTHLFDGGEAELKLIDSDDPLASGLEVMACPPGKKTQPMSLLSGGEQALTAMSLIFAVFLTNPAPICVLDEVDAPLDDANVERFCRLVEEILRQTETRFLIVTHHALTMSRVDRLFGVTMAERGVSKLVSVDLEIAEKLQKEAS